MGVMGTRARDDNAAEGRWIIRWIMLLFGQIPGVTMLKGARQEPGKKRKERSAMSMRRSGLVTLSFGGLLMAAGRTGAQSGDLMRGQGEFIQEHRSNLTHSQMRTVPMPQQRGTIAPAEADQSVRRERTAVAPNAVAAPTPVPIGLERMRGGGSEERREELRGCRGVVAVQRKLPPRRIDAGRIELRFALQPDGGVAGLEVVALSPTDPDVLSCVKRKVAGWRFPAGDSPGPRPVTEQLSLTR